ncbi:uncharacterized protein LOC105447153 [Strongylocentrotus purpuratus]|uniref:Ig-like domain-containing protein n=1 Tax=Strongylocentrotus purpuratus TaxID=7668 RepID=A0A7M7HPC8_STRPU|nr:uncharacterized protein LOC105447153 [Strongylocentrotus purpuratus]|eukprot:XP_011683198.1 PREDICTED: uncharacterized protein LOC105447153 [Strongylocentrotus purpuratus]
MALRITQRTWLVIVIIAFMTTVVHTESGVSGDIPDDVVYTDLHKTVRIGDSVVLTCQFRGTPLAVYWKKGDDPRTAPNLVSWIPTDDVTGLCEGERPCQVMEMNEDRSLAIKEVSIAEEGRYICRVSSYRGILIHNFTDIRLFSIPEEPYPIIKQCANDSSQICSISASESITITCLATSFYPDLDLFFLHGSQKMKDIGSTELTNHDGTKNKSISIKASASNTPYICVASDIPGSKDQRAATIMVNSPMISPTRGNEGFPAPSSTNAGTMEKTPDTMELTPRSMEITPGTMEITPGKRTTKIGNA